MTTITSTGRELHDTLLESFDIDYADPACMSWHDRAEICSLIARNAATYGRIQEAWCSVEMSPQQTSGTERREKNLERRISELVEQLPTVKGEQITVKFGGDPRGYTVKLIMPDHRYNSWGGAEDGIGVATS